MMVTKNHMRDVLGSNSQIKEILETKITKQISILDLENISKDRQSIFSPRIVLNMCLGYLKLSEIDPSMRDYLIEKTCKVSVNYKKKVKPCNLQTVIEDWLESDSPYENEAARFLVKFLSKLSISNQVLFEWVTHKTAVYLKCSDIILSYITDQWVKPQGEYRENE